MQKPTYYQSRVKMPLTAASMYVALCGDEAFGPMSSNGGTPWDEMMAVYYRENPGDKHIRIHRSTQRRMWALIRGIMTATTNPLLGAGPPFSVDGGQALMPPLQEIMRRLYEKSKLSTREGRGGFLYEAVNDRFLKWVSDRIGDAWYRYIRCADLTEGDIAAGAMPAAGSNCGLYVDLVGPFKSGLAAYERGLYYDCWDFGRKRWKDPVECMGTVGATKTSTLLLGKFVSLQTQRLARAVTARPSVWPTVATVVASGLAGYGSYWAGRKYRLLAK
jgi:hypothetical protein